jgi:hypothetical protein
MRGLFFVLIFGISACSFDTSGEAISASVDASVAANPDGADGTPDAAAPGDPDEPDAGDKGGGHHGPGGD